MVTVEEKLYNKMPEEIKSCFKMLPNPGSDEVVELFPNSKSPSKRQTNSWFPSGESNGVDGEAEGYGDSGSAARFFYCAKASKSERNRGCEGLEKEVKGMNFGGELAGNGKPINIGTNKNFHPTVKPIALMEYLIKLVSREGHTILDPFMGSGTTGIAAKKLNRHFIGIEREPDYIKIAEARINAVPKSLFS